MVRPSRRTGFIPLVGERSSLHLGGFPSSRSAGCRAATSLSPQLQLGDLQPSPRHCCQPAAPFRRDGRFRLRNHPRSVEPAWRGSAPHHPAGHRCGGARNICLRQGNRRQRTPSRGPPQNRQFLVACWRVLISARLPAILTLVRSPVRRTGGRTKTRNPANDRQADESVASGDSARTWEEAGPAGVGPGNARASRPRTSLQCLFLPRHT
jgi:hypothetical protein